MQDRHIVVQAEWDPVAKVYVAESEDVPGLATEARSTADLAQKLKIMIPELLALNGDPLSGADFYLEVVHKTVERVRIRA